LIAALANEKGTYQKPEKWRSFSGGGRSGPEKPQWSPEPEQEDGPKFHAANSGNSKCGSVC